MYIFAVHNNKVIKGYNHKLNHYKKSLLSSNSTTMSRSLISSAQIKKLMTGPLKYILLDIDGVLWAGDRIIEGSPQAVKYFREKGLNVRFLSNNASVSREQMVQNLTKRGIEGVTVNEVYNSAYAASLRLLQVLGTNEDGECKVHGNVFVVGEEGLHHEIQKVLADGYITYGMELHNPESVGGYQSSEIAKAWREKVLPAPLKRLVVCDGMTCQMIQAGTQNESKISLSDLRPVAVVAGLDLHFSTLKMAVAAMSIQGPPEDLRKAETAKTLFVATNEDPQIPIGADNILMPGAGTMISAICTAVGRRPDMICGKPFPAMGEAFMEAEHITNPKETCLMIGDRLTTDVAFGNTVGASSMLVLSGAETMEDVEAAIKADNKVLIPDYIGNCLGDFLPK